MNSQKTTVVYSILEVNMPVRKRKGGGYKVDNTTTKKRLTKKQAEKQLAAIEISKKKRKGKK